MNMDEPVTSPKNEKKKSKSKAKEELTSSSTSENWSWRKALGLSKAEAHEFALHCMDVAQRLMREADMEDNLLRGQV